MLDFSRKKEIAFAIVTHLTHIISNAYIRFICKAESFALSSSDYSVHI